MKDDIFAMLPAGMTADAPTTIRFIHHVPDSLMEALEQLVEGDWTGILYIPTRHAVREMDDSSFMRIYETHIPLIHSLFTAALEQGYHVVAFTPAQPKK